jgi:hypothetical protein
LSRFLERRAAGSLGLATASDLAEPSPDSSLLKVEIVLRLYALSDPPTTAAQLIDGQRNPLFQPLVLHRLEGGETLNAPQNPSATPSSR